MIALVRADAKFAVIAADLATEIRRGVRRAGDRLPSTRELAVELGVNRNTAVAAYAELLAQGWIVARGAAGTFVAAELPDVRARPKHAEPLGFAERAGY
jgi:GntR family transcriptional regulator / MocR family aminotransferase